MIAAQLAGIDNLIFHTITEENKIKYYDTAKIYF